MRQFVDTWDNLNYRWSQWVLGYGPRRQLELMQMMGFQKPGWRGLTLALVTLVAVFFVALGCWYFIRRPDRRDPARRSYDKFCNKLKRCGITRRSYEGPMDFALRAGRRVPRLKNAIETITGIYIEVRYGSKTDKLGQLESSVRQFKPAETLATAKG